MLPPRSRTACRSLAPEGAAAPAPRQSRLRGPCLNGEPPWSFALRNFLPPEGAAAPTARQSWFRGPFLNGGLSTYIEGTVPRLIMYASL